MRNSALYLFFLLVIGCSTGIVVHDETRAAELIVDFLSGFKSDKGKKLSYEWTDDRFKEEVSLGEFSRIVSSIRSKNQGAEIRLIGYEIFGPVETIIVYASSEVTEGKMYFRFILVGTKSKDYYLLNLDINDSEFSKKGIYKEYEQSILVKGV
ncbi:MAG: hypothetical protein ACYTFU_06230 [Planctomycetota bacterium]|jgi:hypothetical protein